VASFPRGEPRVPLRRYLEAVATIERLTARLEHATKLIGEQDVQLRACDVLLGAALELGHKTPEQ
jgi:hypothetical protein